MTIEEQKYVDELRKRIQYLEQSLKARTEEKEQATKLAVKYLSKYIEDNNLTDEVEKGINEWQGILNKKLVGSDRHRIKTM
jgi:ribosome assembly protein YihI (activator of Der GTPase)